MMAFAWFGLGSNLSFGLADYFLVNRPTGPFHFFLLLFSSIFFAAFDAFFDALFAFSNVFLLFCFLCFFRLSRRNRDIARQTLVAMSTFYAIVDQLNCPLGTNGKGTTSTAWRFPLISTSSVFDDDLTRASPIPQDNVGEKAPLVTTPTASSPEKGGNRREAPLCRQVECRSGAHHSLDGWPWRLDQ